MKAAGKRGTERERGAQREKEGQRKEGGGKPRPYRTIFRSLRLWIWTALVERYDGQIHLNFPVFKACRQGG